MPKDTETNTTGLEEVENKRSQLPIIIGSSSVGFVAIFLSILGYICYNRKQKLKTLKNSIQPKFHVKINNWVREKNQDEINKEIHSTEGRRKEYDNKVYRGDIVRFSITSAELMPNARMLSSGDSASHITESSVSGTDNSEDTVKEPTIINTDRPNSGYLEPIEKKDNIVHSSSLHIYADIDDVSNICNVNKSLNSFQETNSLNKTEENLLPVCLPSTSCQLFHSGQDINDLKNTSIKFAAYLQIDEDSPWLQKTIKRY